MNNYDVTLKLLLQASADSFLRQLSGVTVARWLNIEMPQVLANRVDLLGAALDNDLVHVELQSSNESKMALRMAEYALQIYRRLDKFPKQIVLYVGEAPVRMETSLNGPNAAFQFTLIDIRDLDAALLMKSPHIEENILAILTRFQDRTGLIREILRRIAALEDPERREAFERFLIISGLRRLAPKIKEEAQHMPILNDMIDHELFGPAIRQGLEQGLKQGLEQGLTQGRQELLRRLLADRFGALPAWVEPGLSTLSALELDQMAIRAFHVSRLEELFPQEQ